MSRKFSLTKSIKKLGIKNFSQDKLYILDDLLSHQSSPSYLQILKTKDSIKKQNNIRNLYLLQNANRLSGILNKNRSISINNTTRQDIKAKELLYQDLINCLKQSINKRSIQEMLRLFQQFGLKSQDPNMKLMCLLDQIVLIEYLGLSKQKIKKLIYLSDFLVILKKYQTSVQMLQVGLAMAMAQNLINLELTIYDKLGVSYYYLQLLKQSVQYHNYFAAGKTRATNTIRNNVNTIIRTQIKQPFNDKFFQALSTPVFSQSSIIPQIDQMLKHFMKRPDMKTIYKNTVLSLPNIGNISLKSHLSGLRQRRASQFKKF